MKRPHPIHGHTAGIAIANASEACAICAGSGIGSQIINGRTYRRFCDCVARAAVCGVMEAYREYAASIAGRTVFTHSGYAMPVAEFVADVQAAIRRALSPVQQQRLAEWSGVSYLDGRLAGKLGREFLRCGLFPTADYFRTRQIGLARATQVKAAA